MSEASAGSKPVASMDSLGGAGAMLRAARQQRGLHIGALAATMKVPQAKLEALEADRYQDLPDTTFTRALALAVSRALKIDPAPGLACLPGTSTRGLDRADRGLNAPFHERPGHTAPVNWIVWRQPAFWIVALLLVAAAGVVWVPMDWLQGWSWPRAALRVPGSDGATSTSMPAALPASALAGAIVESVVAPAISPPAPAGTAPDVSAATGAPPVVGATPDHAATRIRAIEASWVHVTDAKGQVLLSRQLSAGEVVGFGTDGALKIRIGNVRGTEIVRRGQLVDLTPSARGNMATVELR